MKNVQHLNVLILRENKITHCLSKRFFFFPLKKNSTKGFDLESLSGTWFFL